MRTRVVNESRPWVDSDSTERRPECHNLLKPRILSKGISETNTLCGGCARRTRLASWSSRSPQGRQGRDAGQPCPSLQGCLLYRGINRAISPKKERPPYGRGKLGSRSPSLTAECPASELGPRTWGAGPPLVGVLSNSGQGPSCCARSC